MNKTRIQLLSPVKGYLDVVDNIPLPLNLELADIRDISKRSGSGTRTIQLPGNKNNNKLLGHLYDINITDSSFNINTLQSCLIEKDGIIIQDNMYFQLKSVKKVQKTANYDYDVIYEGIVFDSTSDFFTKINGLELDSKDDNGNTLLDMSVFNHVLGATYIVSTYDNTYIDGFKYLLPWAPPNNPPNVYLLSEMKPAIYVRTYWDKIFDNAGYTYQFDEIDDLDIRFNQLIIPYNGDTITLSPEIQDSYKVIAQTTSTISGTLSSQLILTDEIQDNQNQYDNTTGVYTSELTISNPSSTEWKFEVSYNVSIVNNEAFTVRLYRAGSIGLQVGLKIKPSITIEPNIGSIKTLILNTRQIQLGSTFSTGSTQVMSFTDTYTINGNPCVSGTQFINNFILNTQLTSGYPEFSKWVNNADVNQDADVSYSYNINSIKMTITNSIQNIDSGQTILMNNYIPTKIKQADFIKGICQMFNLYIDIDKINVTNLIIKTRDRYYDEGVVVDWTNKLVKDQSQDMKFLPDLGGKRLILSYKDDKDFYNQTYLDNIKETYGQIEYVFENEYVRNTVRKDLIFSPTPMSQTTFGPVLPNINGGSPKTNIRILLDSGDKPTQSEFYIREAGIDLPFTTYPHLSHFDDNMNPNFDLNYGVNDFYFYNPNSTTDNNLYNLHWRRTLGQINNGKLLSAYFILKGSDIKNLKLNDKIRIDNSYWNINKVIDYDANNFTPTKVELISIDDDLELPFFQTKKIIKPVSTDTIFVPVKTKDKSRSEWVNINNWNLEMDGIDNTVSTETSGKVNGINNRINGSTSSKVYIDGDNNNADSSAYIIGNNNIVDPYLDKVFLWVDDYHATQSNIFVTPENLVLDGPNPTINGIPYPSGLKEDLEETLSIGNITGTYSIILTNGVSISGGEEPATASSVNILNLGDSTISDSTWYLGDRDGNLSEVRFDGTDAHFENASGFTRINGTDVRLDTSGEIFIVNTPPNGSTSSNILLREPSGEVHISQFTEYDLINGLGGSASIQGWPSVLSIDNTSGANDAIINTGQVIKSGNGGGQLDLDYFGSPNEVFLSNDNGGGADSALYLAPGGASLNTPTDVLSLSNQFSQLRNFVGLLQIGSITQSKPALNTSFGNIMVGDNSVNDVRINPNTVILPPLNGVAINSKDSIFRKAIENSVMLGGQNLDAAISDTVYVPYFNISTNYWIPADPTDVVLFINGGGDVTVSNFTYADLAGLTGSTASIQGLPSVLSIDNTTGTNDIIIDNNQVIKSGNGGGQLDLDYGGATDEISLSTDNGGQLESYVYMTPNNLDLASTGAIISLGSGNINMFVSEIFQVDGTYNNTTSQQVILFGDNFSAPTQTNNGNDRPGVIISSRNSTINAGLTNSIVLGGTNITAVNSNTAYVDYFNIKRLLTTPAVSPLAIDINGNVVSGATLSIPTSSTWSQVLSNGNLSGGNNVLMTVGDIIGSSTGTNSINMNTSGGVRIIGNTFSELQSSVRVLMGMNGDVDIRNNTSSSQTTTSNDKNSVFVGTNGSTIGTSSVNSVIVGGRLSTINSNDSFIGGASGSTIFNSVTGAIVGGMSHNINTSSNNSVIVGGITHNITGTSSRSYIIGGQDSSISGTSIRSGILGGNQHTIGTASNRSTIIGGVGHTINSGTNTSIIAGSNCTISGVGSVIIGGNGINATYTNTIYHNDRYQRNNATVTTTNATVTTIHSFTPDGDGVYNVQYKVTGYRASNGTALTDIVYGGFLVVGGVVTQISTTVNNRRTTMPVLLPDINVTLDTNGSIIRVRANGAVGFTIVWNAALELMR